jgi:hypothetical protein
MDLGRHLVLTVAASLALTGVAEAQTTLSARVKVSPGQAGTAKRPQGVKLTLHADITTPGDVGHPIPTGFELWTGKGVVFNGRRHPSCPLTTMSRGGPSACPPRSIMGKTGGSFEPGVRSEPKTTLINAPDGGMTIWAVLQNPARVQAAIPSRVTTVRRSVWPRREAWTIPRSLQIVAGIPITLPAIDLEVGGKSWARDYVALTGCGFAWRLLVHTVTGMAETPATLDTRGRVPCRR